MFKLVNKCSTGLNKSLKNEIKEKDGSIVTDADKDIDWMIYKELSKISSSIPVISEENNNKKKIFYKIYFGL